MSDGLKAALEGRMMFPSSGNAKEDARESARIIRREAYLAEGLCPNGCAPLQPYAPEGVELEDAATCPSCGFVGCGPSFNVKRKV